MIDREFILEKINLITRDLKRLEVFSNLTFDQIATDFHLFTALNNILMETISRAIDINQHFISELSGSEIEAPKTYRETFLLLGNLNILPKDFAEEISKSAGLRNIIVHGYSNPDKGINYKKVEDVITQYVKYSNDVIKFLK